MAFRCTYLTDDKIIQSKVETFIHEWNSLNKQFSIKTSGSTGLPKEIKLEKKFAVKSALLTGEYFKFNNIDSMLLCISPDTIGGTMIIVRAIVWKKHLIVVSPSRNPLKNLKEKIGFASFVPLQIQSILSENPTALSQIDTILIGGGPLNYSLKEKLNSIHSNSFESFGMTETYSHIALRKCKKNTYLFDLLDGIDITKTNFTNQLIINSLELGIQDLITNDIVSIPNKHQFDWLGRIDFVINSGGIKFHPELIERKLEHYFNHAYFIHKETSKEYGEIIILILECENSKQLSDTYLNDLKSILQRYEIPKKIYFINPFIRTESNKINRLETYNSIFN